MMQLDGSTVKLGTLLKLKDPKYLRGFIYNGSGKLMDQGVTVDSKFKDIEYIFKIKKIRRQKARSGRTLVFNLTIAGVLDKDQYNSQTLSNIERYYINKYGTLMIPESYLSYFEIHQDIKSILEALDILQKLWS